MPELTVVIPVYNGRRFLREAVLSCLGEETAAEILIVDDGSDDGSADTVRDLPVAVVSHPHRRGASAAYNTGLSRAGGELIAFLNSDDRMTEGGLRWRLEWLRQNPGESGVMGLLAGNIDGQGNPLGIAKPDAVPMKLTLDVALGASGPFAILWLAMFRKNFLARIGNFDERLIFAQDRDYLYRALAHGPLPFVPRPVAYYRWHEANLSGAWTGERAVLNRAAWAEGALVAMAHGAAPFRHCEPHEHRKSKN